VTNLTGEQKITFAVREVGAHSGSQGPSPRPWGPTKPLTNFRYELA